MHSLRSLLRAALVILVALTVITGVLYPLAVTGIAQAAFPHQAEGSLVVKDGQAVGSDLIGQPFTDPKYFWGRPSATEAFPYNAAASSGSNLGPTNPALGQAVQARIKALQDANRSVGLPATVYGQAIPVDLVTASGSGLDPDISVAAALYQVPRVARARGLSEAQVEGLVQQNTEGRCAAGSVTCLLAVPRVNVLRLNLELDGAK